MRITHPIILGSDEWKQVCGDSHFSNIVKLGDFDRRRLVNKLLEVLGEDCTQVKQPKKKRSPEKRKYTKHSKTVELFNSYYSSSITQTAAHKYVAKQLGIKPNSVREAVRRHRNKIKSTSI